MGLDSKKFQESMLKWFVLGSATLHGAVLIIYSYMSQPEPPALDDPWVIETDLIDLGEPSSGALTQVKKAEETKVSEKMLPQLPKKVEIESPSEKVEVADTPGEVKKDGPPASEMPSSSGAASIEDRELQKRLALEKLRKMGKLGQETTSASNTKISKAGDEKTGDADSLAKSEALRSIVKRGMQKKLEVYVKTLQQHVHQSYQLPEVYNFKKSGYGVILSIKIGANGQIMKMQVRESSGDSAFDTFAQKALKDAAPLPRPPQEYVQEVISFHFSL